MSTIFELSHTIVLDATSVVDDVTSDYTVPMIFAVANLGIRRNDLTSFYTGDLSTQISTENVFEIIFLKNQVTHEDIDFATICVQEARSIISGEKQHLRFTLLSEIHSKLSCANRQPYLYSGDQIVMNFVQVVEHRAYYLKLSMIIEHSMIVSSLQQCRPSCHNMVPCPTINVSSGIVSYPGYSVRATVTSNDAVSYVQGLRQKCSFVLGQVESENTYVRTPTFSLLTASIDVNVQLADSTVNPTPSTSLYTAGQEQLRLSSSSVTLDTVILGALFMRIGHYFPTETSSPVDDVKGYVQIVVRDSGERSYVNFEKGSFTHITFGGTTYTIIERFVTHAVMDADFLNVVVSDGIVHLHVS